jgi:hypothetical protein
MSLNLFVCYFLGDPGLQRYLALSGAGAEASCSAALRTAKAVVEEAGSSVSSALHKLANTSEGHAENTFHKVAGEQQLSLDVPLTEMSMPDTESFPVLLLSDWIKLILNL